MPRLHAGWLLLALCPLAAALAAPAPPDLLDQVQERAFRYFWERADSTTGLVTDRARNQGTDDYRVASIAATGFGLAALPIGVAHGWVSRADAEARALLTLDYLADRSPQEHGWYYHFVDQRTGQREWGTEISSIDTGLMLMGALVAGQAFGGRVAQRADELLDRLDWRWMLTNGGTRPDKRVVSHGWKPEGGWLPYNWDDMSEGPLLYLLGMGARRDPLPAECWAAMRREPFAYGGFESLNGGPLFLHQMVQGFVDLRDQRDSLGYDYFVSSVNATLANRQFCLDHAAQRPGYGPEGWGLNAGDGPHGYLAYGVPGPEDGTLSPTAALAAIVHTPELAIAAGRALFERHGDRLWGRYGFANGYNVGESWYDGDVIGIDLGMALLALENHRSGLVWRLVGQHEVIRRGLRAAGFHVTVEPPPRPLRAATG